jgi:hypothetical protein
MTQHLIHIGWAKAGSSFLQEWFARHPQLHYAPGGIAGFGNVLEMARTLEMPYRYFVTSAEQLACPNPYVGELHLGLARGEPMGAYPMQTRQAEICTRLGTLFPGSRILIVTRGFRGLARSGYSQTIKNGRVTSLREHFELRRGSPQTGVYRKRDFDYVIGLYRAAFGAENVIVLPYELLRDDQAKFLAILEERLGLEHADIEIGRVNESLTPEELYWYPKISRVVSATASRLGDRAFRKIYSRYVGVTLRNGLRPMIRVLARIKPSGRITDADFPPISVDNFAGKAESLRGDPLYAPYADDYLWTEESLRPRG